MIGQTLEHYRIVEKIGAGGMGEVYRARDERLGRDVAIKVLPEAFAHDPERLARFEREAQLLASLNHPNIAAIYGLEEADSIRFLVLELVPGETLAERLGRGTLPVDEALPICRQMAEALEAAHEKGILHRDLKPGNVKVTHEGKVKVLDFGLAKAFAGEAPVDLSQSPTISEAATRAGVLLGTAAYMSPEQARGKPVDKRTDIWSFGCVLYECLAGRQAFRGETISDTIAKILAGEPDWAALPSTTPPTVQLLLRRCLHKDLNRRIRDISHARIELEGALAVPIAAWPGTEAQHVPHWRRALPWALAGLFAALAVVSALVPQRGSEPASRPVVRSTIVLPDSAPVSKIHVPGAALSPDGRLLVYPAGRGETAQLYLRPVNQQEATAVPGTQGAYGPFFSPDAQWLGFFAQGKLKKISIGGGVPQSLCDASLGHGASWGPNGTIVFTPVHGTGLSLLSASGGPPQVLTKPEESKGEAGHHWPNLLPGGHAVIFTTEIAGKSYDEARIEMLRLDTGERRTLLEGGTGAQYVPTGHLVFGRGEALLAVPFDLQRLVVTGSPVRVVEGVYMHRGTGGVHYSFSQDGSLVYLPVGIGQPKLTLVWVDRKGGVKPLAAPPNFYLNPRLSPDGQRLAVQVSAANDDLWIYELGRGTMTRLTFQGENFLPVWAPDGNRLALGHFTAGPPNLHWMSADGLRGPERLLSSDYSQDPSAWSPDGKLLAFDERDPATDWDIWLLPLEGERKAYPYLRTPFAERFATFSPDEHWMAYVSNESGRDEIYVQAFPGPGRKWQISTEGGTQPVWAANGRELFYRNGDKFMAVSITTRPALQPGIPQLLFTGHYGVEFHPNRGTDYDVSRDGQRFVLCRPEREVMRTHVHLVLNWFEELKRRVPAAKK